MIEILKFIEQLELLHKMLTVESKDDDPAKIITRGKIRELLKKYQHDVDEFEKYIEENEKKEHGSLTEKNGQMILNLGGKWENQHYNLNITKIQH